MTLFYQRWLYLSKLTKARKYVTIRRLVWDSSFFDGGQILVDDLTPACERHAKEGAR
jgi:hypothetical protein